MILVWWLIRGHKPQLSRVWQSHSGLWQLGTLSAKAILVAFKPGKYQDWNASSISFSKLHSWIAVRLQALCFERIIALPEMLKPLSFCPHGLGHQPRHTAIAELQWTVSRGFLLNDIPKLCSPSITQPPCYRLPFCSFKAFFYFFCIYLIYLTFTLPWPDYP